MTNIESIIDTYVLGWNSNNSEQRKELMKQVLTQDCLYFDSHLPEPTEGKDLHCQFIDRFRSKFDDLSLKLTSTPTTHHGYFRFTWQMVKADQSIFVQGNFFGELDQEDKITKLVGFVDS